MNVDRENEKYLTLPDMVGAVNKLILEIENGTIEFERPSGELLKKLSNWKKLARLSNNPDIVETQQKTVKGDLFTGILVLAGAIVLSAVVTGILYLTLGKLGLKIGLGFTGMAFLGCVIFLRGIATIFDNIGLKRAQKNADKLRDSLQTAPVAESFSEKRKTSKLSIAALILSLVSFSPLIGVPAIFISIMAIKKCKKYQLKGKTLAIISILIVCVQTAIFIYNISKHISHQ